MVMQVSNWFINARVRLWKPMVEEMYVEEIKDNEQNGSEEKKTKSDQNEDSISKSNPPNEKIQVPPQENQNQNRGFMSKQENPSNQNTPISISTSPTGLNLRNPPTFSLIGSPEIDRYPQENSKKQRSEEMLQSSVDHRQNHDRFTLMGGLGSYPIGEIGRYNSDQFGAPFAGNGVSLTLGLPHCENISMSGTHHNFLGNQTVQMGRGVEIGETHEFSAMNAPASSHSAAMFENINIQNRKRFAAQLLPDFVA